MEVNSIVLFSIGLVVFGVLAYTTLPSVFNNISAITLTSASANALWGLIPFLMIAIAVLYLLKNG